MTKLARDTWLVFAMAVKLSLRNVVWLVIGIMQPLFFLLLFAPLLKAIFGDDAYPIFIPGLLIQLALFGTLYVGFGLVGELRAGVIERMRVTPVSRLALLLGRAGRDVFFLVCQALILIVVALPFGLSVEPGPLALTLALLVLIGLLSTSVSYAIALILRTEDSLAALLNSVSMPLLLLSGIILPMALAPGWLQGIAKVNPMYYAVEASRRLFRDDPTDSVVVQALVILAVLAAGTSFWAARQFARSVR